jgi:serine/threonine protein phosphatase PrpC
LPVPAIPAYKYYISMSPTSSPMNGSSGQVSAASAQGSRPAQEDRAQTLWIDLPAVPNSPGWLLAVFDGHRHADVADKASKALPSLFKTALQASLSDVPQALRETFRALHALTQNALSGSTASIVYIPQEAGHAYVAVLGDSPVAVLDSQSRLYIGPDHNVRTNIPERASAEARGGFYQGGYLEDSDRPGTGLQMARALGDADLARVLSREPEIETVALGGRGVVLVGTDGLISAGQDPARRQLERLVKLIARGGDAHAVVEDALKRRTGDNVSAVVWKRG